MIRNLKIKFVLIIMLLLTIVLTTLLAGLFMYQKNQLYVDSVNAMKEAMVLQADTQSSLYYELFGLYSRSSRYPYFNTFVLEVDRIDKTVTAIGYEEELDDEKKEYLLSLVNAVPAVNNAEGILPAENLRYYVNTTSRGVKIAFLDKEYEDASLRDLLKNSLWIVSLSLFGFLVISLIMTKIATAPVEKSWKQQKQLVADMSHELKTPLTTIMGYAEIIGNGIARTEDIPEFAGKIRLEAARLLSLIEDIIKLSRLDENELTSRFEPVELAEVCRSVVKKLSDKAQKADVSLTFAGSPCVVNGIESILYEILFNLTDNAIIYNRKGGEVRLSLTEAGGRATVVVEDTGIGIAHEHIDRIFERFYRVDKSHSRETGGTGLGLSIVKHGALLHGASLKLESEPGEGTRVTLTFNGAARA